MDRNGKIFFDVQMISGKGYIDEMLYLEYLQRIRLKNK